jgi:hypothetical protein
MPSRDVHHWMWGHARPSMLASVKILRPRICRISRKCYLQKTPYTKHPNVSTEH